MTKTYLRQKSLSIVRVNLVGASLSIDWQYSDNPRYSKELGSNESNPKAEELAKQLNYAQTTATAAA